jgi:hypothetical protein
MKTGPDSMIAAPARTAGESVAGRRHMRTRELLVIVTDATAVIA